MLSRIENEKMNPQTDTGENYHNRLSAIHYIREIYIEEPKQAKSSASYPAEHDVENLKSIQTLTFLNFIVDG